MKILIIEDSNLYRKVHAKYVKASLPEAEVLTASDGQEGYEIFLKEKPDYILLDLLMPVMGGIDFLKALKDHETSNTIVYIVSADVQRYVREEAEALGARSFISKPFTAEKAEALAEEIRGETHA